MANSRPTGGSERYSVDYCKTKISLVNSKLVGLQTFHEKFSKIENDLKLFELRIQGVRIWEYLRFPINIRIFKPEADFLELESTIFNPRKRLRFFFNAIFNVLRNPLLLRKKDLLFINCSRRILQSDGYWWDITTDHVINKLNVSYNNIESHFQLEHKKPERTPNLKYFDILDFLIFVSKKIGIGQVTFSTKECNSLREIERLIWERFEIRIDIISMVRKFLHARKIRQRFYYFLLKLQRPKLVVLFQGYGNEDFVEVAKSLHIPVVEFQHGVIHQYHVGYAFEGESREKHSFPDFLFVFGDYWVDNVEYPIPKKRVLSTAYPFLEEEIKKYEGIQKKKQILFISQGTIGEMISKFAYELSQVKELNEYQIVFKLHPRDCVDWQDRYPWLLDTKIDVIDNAETSLYRLLAESTIQIGVYSTAIIEGLAFELETYLIDYPGIEILEPLIESGTAKKVKNVDEVTLHILDQSGSKKFDRQRYFKSNAVPNIIKILKAMLKQ